MTAIGKKRVALAYSGGLDTSTLIYWLQDQGYDVVAMICDLGQPTRRPGISAIADKALRLGAVASYAIDVRDEFCDTNIACSIAANGMYENTYPLLSALSRPLISKHLVEIAEKEGCEAIAHGCTGKGNDQVRFEFECKALNPDIQVLCPVRSWELVTRSSEIEFCAAHGIQVEATKESPYSVDENVWGRAIECGALEDPWCAPRADVWQMTVDPAEAPDESEEVVIGFEQGKPVSLDGESLSLLSIVERLNDLGGRNGFGRIDMVEDRLVGLKSRECYEQPAALAIIQAHKALEALCLPRDLLAAKLDLEHAWSRQVYSGLWYSPLKEAYDAFFASTQKTVTGDVRLSYRKGSCTVTGRRSPNSIYDFGLATYDEGDTFDRGAAQGFMDLYGLPNYVWAKKVGISA